MLLFFRQFEPQVFLFLFLFIHVLTNCNLYTWQLLQTWPVEKARNFPFQKGKKILKNFPKHKSIFIWEIEISESAERKSIPVCHKCKAVIENTIFYLIGGGVSSTNCAPILKITFKKHLANFVIYIFISYCT